MKLIKLLLLFLFTPGLSFAQSSHYFYGNVDFPSENRSALNLSPKQVPSLTGYWSTNSSSSIPENLLTYSEDLSQISAGNWNTPVAASIGADATENPINGATDADKIIEDGTNTYHYARHNIFSFEGGVPYVISGYIKEAGRQRCKAQITSASDYVDFSLTDGTIHSQGVASRASVTDAGSGWWRFQFEYTPATTASREVAIVITASPYQGDSTSGIYAWGIQVRRRDIWNASYLKTLATQLFGSNYYLVNQAVYRLHDQGTGSYDQVQTAAAQRPIMSRSDNLENQILYSSLLDTASSWIAYKSALAFGSSNVATYTEDASAGVQHKLYRGNSPFANSVLAGLSYQVDFSVKANGRDYIHFYTNTGWQHSIQIKLSDCTLGTVAGGSASISDEGGGWCRVKGTFTAASTAVNPFEIYLCNNAAYNVTYDGDGASGIFFKNPALRVASADPTYLATTTFPWYRGINGLPVLMFNATAYMITTAIASNLWGASAKTTFAVIRPGLIGSGTEQKIFGQSLGGRNSLFAYSAGTIAPTGNYGFWSDNDGANKYAIAPTSAANEVYILAMTHNGTDAIAYKNGVAGTPSAVGASAVMTGAIQLGGYSTGPTWPYYGAVAEVVTYNRVLSADELIRLNMYFRRKYSTQ